MPAPCSHTDTGVQAHLGLPRCVTAREHQSSLSWSPPDPSLSLQQECCGTSGPMDWVNFTSAFRATTPEVVFPWPPLCCRRTGNFIPVNEEGCRLGHLDYLFTKVCLFLLCLSVCLALSGSSVSFSLLSVCLSSPPQPPSDFLNPPSVCPPPLPSPPPPCAGQRDAYRRFGLTQTWRHLKLFSGCLGNQSNKNNTGSTPPITTNMS